MSLKDILKLGVTIAGCLLLAAVLDHAEHAEDAEFDADTDTSSSPTPDADDFSFTNPYLV